MKFSFQVNYTALHRSNSPDCYQFNIMVLNNLFFMLFSKIEFSKTRLKEAIEQIIKNMIVQ